MKSKKIDLLLESKAQYTEHLCDILVKPMYEAFAHEYQISVSKSQTAKDLSHLQAFQKALENVPLWNTDVIRDHTEAIPCDYLHDLVKAVFTIYVKVMLASQAHRNDRDRVRVKIPNLEHFIHRCYVSVARSLWKKPYLFDHTVKSGIRQQNVLVCEEMIRAAIQSAIRDSLPMKMLAQSVSAQSTSRASSEESEQAEESDSSSDTDTESDASETTEEAEEIAQPDPSAEPEQEPSDQEPSEEAEAEDDETDAVSDAQEGTLADPPADPLADPSAEPSADPPADPLADPSADPLADPSADTLAEPPADPLAEPPADPPADPLADPLAEPSDELESELPSDPSESSAEDKDAIDADTGDPTQEPIPNLIDASPGSDTESEQEKHVVVIEPPPSKPSDPYIDVVKDPETPADLRPDTVSPQVTHAAAQAASYQDLLRNHSRARDKSHKLVAKYRTPTRNAFF